MVYVRKWATTFGIKRVHRAALVRDRPLPVGYPSPSAPEATFSFGGLFSCQDATGRIRHTDDFCLRPAVDLTRAYVFPALGNLMRDSWSEPGFCPVKVYVDSK